MSRENGDKYLDPKRNPLIKTYDEDHTPADNDETSADPEGRIPFWPEDRKKAGLVGKEETLELLEKDVLNLMGDGSGAYEIVVEDGEVMPLFAITRTVDGRLEVKTAEGELKNFGDLTALERKLILHDLKVRK